MQKEVLDFLIKLLETPSVSGFEQRIQRVVKKRIERYADNVEIDVHGNLIAALNPQGKIRVMLAGHCDQIGMMVTHIDDAGFIYFRAVGGIDPLVLPGAQLTIHARGGPVTGIVGHTPIHLVPSPERGKKIELKKLWIDIGENAAAKVKAKISVGDPISFQLGVHRLSRNVISSPGCDDRVGVFVVMEAFRLVAQAVKKEKKFPVALFAVSTVQEELGLRGARTASYGIDPLVGIAVDVTHASDSPGTDAKETGTVTLGDGPIIARGANVNPVLEELLVDTAKKKKIRYQPLGAPGATGTDANAIQITRKGVAASLVGIPNRYMHTPVEVVDLRDLETAAKLIAETVRRIRPRMTFVPS